jgi:CubicO group peptidase (beta-lactamase class C family)
MNPVIDWDAYSPAVPAYHDRLACLRRAFAKEKILSCLVLHKDQVLLEYYRNNKLQHALQKVNSCTKSVVSALVGIVLDRGLIPSIHTSIADYFPNLLMAQADRRKRDITIYHLLTMTAGFDWPEFGDWHYFSPMAYQRDICRFILDRPLCADPGTMMNYNSGCSHLLATILQHVAGMSLQAFAEQVLFQPLGILKIRWYADRQGVNKGADGLRMTARDMARFGTLFLHRGRCGAQQLLPAAWVHESTAPHFTTYHDIGAYGYHWWVASRASESASAPDSDATYFFALGYGGQYILVDPLDDLVAVFTSELYRNSLRPLTLFRTHMLNS